MSLTSAPGGGIQSPEPLVLLALLWFASISLARSFFESPFLLPLLLPRSMSSQDRFACAFPAWYPFAALPLGGQALLLAELDADAPALPASNCCCFHFSFRVLRAICCLSLIVIGAQHANVHFHTALIKRFSHASLLRKGGRSDQSWHTKEPAKSQSTRLYRVPFSAEENSTTSSQKCV